MQHALPGPWKSQSLLAAWNSAWIHIGSALFGRRKAAELAGNNKNKSKVKGNADAPPPAIVPSSSGGPASAQPTAAAANDASKFQKVPKANKGKKSKPGKGQKMDTAMLGFQNKMDFTVLQRGDDFA